MTLFVKRTSLIKSSIQIVKEETFFKDLISFKHIDKRLFIFSLWISPQHDIGLLSKGRTSGNKGSNVLFGIIK